MRRNGCHTLIVDENTSFYDAVMTTPLLRDRSAGFEEGHTRITLRYQHHVGYHAYQVNGYTTHTFGVEWLRTQCFTHDIE